ncbi:hypothetical protein [Thalassobaculum litoreum]|uniref:Uncharacterized protein n=1 Tax=Thalassobaculum litoreum DSM 18839 TaxID=1123362 RepID=A0A8G2F0U0_9PROT|nr:hypothetical protein [Thalassobaculum litoreum]SDG58885.1 hypothetical protein SAMN05660686_04946 [Thalassobaculum litoreum DSM 18839]
MISNLINVMEVTLERYRYRIAGISKPELERLASELAIMVEGERDNRRLGSPEPEHTVHATPDELAKLLEIHGVRAAPCAMAQSDPN